MYNTSQATDKFIVENLFVKQKKIIVNNKTSVWKDMGLCLCMCVVDTEEFR